jgi:PPK2 family polyphosphate:nucleotide phosphotransferase
MSHKVPKALARLHRYYRVDSGKGFSLKRFDPDDHRGLDLKDLSDMLLAESVKVLTDLQERLYAQDRWSVLLVFQALDAAGKDGTIKHVMSGLNPQGCEVHSFKAPSPEELDHDFLWRTTVKLPRRGHIGIFNRSYYEEVLIARVHPEILAHQQLPDPLVSKKIWKERFEDICAFERYLARQGVVVRKFFLHLSKDEQRRRFLARLDEPEKNWKFSLGDVHEREHFDDYQRVYGDAIKHTATENAPWYVVPADRKWFSRLVVASAVIEAIESIDPRFPEVSVEARQRLQVARAALEDPPPQDTRNPGAEKKTRRK